MMHGRLRKFSGEVDIQAMVDVARAFPEDNLHVVDLPYRLSSWALDDPDNVGIWESADGRVLAWVMMQSPFWMVDYAFHRKVGKEMHREILAWAEERARAITTSPFGRPTWFVSVFTSQIDRICDLEEAGFESQANTWEKVLLQRSAQNPGRVWNAPPGFHIRPIMGESEVGAYVELHRSVFESKNMTADWRLRTLLRPEYQPELDLVAVAPDGRLAAFCICWISEDALGMPVGQIEPLGVHKDFRGSGLGRAILSEGLRRLFLRGASLVLVETDKNRYAALGAYKAVGFQTAAGVLIYGKDILLDIR